MLSLESRWLIRTSWPLRRFYLKQIVVVSMASALTLLDPLVLKWLIDGALPSRNLRLVVLAAVAFFGVFLCSAACNAWGQLLDAYATQRLMLTVRGRLVRHLQKLSSDYFLHVRLGDTLHCIQQDVDLVCDLGGRVLGTLLRVLVLTTASVGIMLYLSWRLTLLVLLALPIIV